MDYLCCSRNQQLNTDVLEEFTQFEAEDSLYILALVDEPKEIHNLSALTSSILKQELPSPSRAGCDVDKPDEDVWFEPELQLDAQAQHPTGEFCFCIRCCWTRLNFCSNINVVVVNLFLV